MDVDENVLIAEVARKRASQSGDAEEQEFIRRQQTQLRREEWQGGANIELDINKSVTAGSSIEALEYELVKYLLKSGHKSFEVMEGRYIVEINVANEILYNLEYDNMHFTNPVYESLLEVYRQEWKKLGIGVEVPAQYFVNHSDPEVCNAAVDILTSDDNYVPSEIWRQKDVHIESESDILRAGVHKAIMLYRSKVLEKMIDTLRARLDDSTLSEDEILEYTRQLTKLNEIKLTLSKKSQRLIM